MAIDQIHGKEVLEGIMHYFEESHLHLSIGPVKPPFVNNFQMERGLRKEDHALEFKNIGIYDAGENIWAISVGSSDSSLITAGLWAAFIPQNYRSHIENMVIPFKDSLQPAHMVKHIPSGYILMAASSGKVVRPVDRELPGVWSNELDMHLQRHEITFKDGNGGDVFAGVYDHSVLEKLEGMLWKAFTKYTLPKRKA